ncbi:ParB-like nuclease domain protein [Aquimixticola soesokkakensis]|uniref:ParB-like nuclease domain protein n=1 Tax=Aquimixticola soesokkakensis TaxID=1519096 RepID=A0A1Y5RW02_9RHOB|nr:ParB N-terminal domain-containing protein [Aquimixticola soesokkakensis]SLN25427.1 ParB-like nuclease domain protein [Aquimixticola soesokkakensis]
MSKRRIFDIDFPEADTPASDATPPAPPSEETRRGPMASAISENADALRARQAAEAAIRAENDQLAHEHVRLKRQGLIVDLIPLDQILTTKLTRDRAVTRDPDLEELKTSIREIGLSNPIRVEQTEAGFELVQGYRRLSAYRALFEETGDEAFAKIPAGLVAKGEALEGLYRRMVDENLVRRDISFAEMAELARAYVADDGTQAQTIEEAVAALYGSAARQKRSYIRHFASLLQRIGSHLKFPEVIPRALGLDLEKLLADTVGAQAQLRNALTARMPTTPEAELAVLRDFLKLKAQPEPETAVKPAPGPTPSERSAKTTFRCATPLGVARCAATEGRIEIRAEVNFASSDPQKLEAAVAAFFAALDQ